MLVELNRSRMDCHYVHLGPYILNSPYAMMPLGEVSRQRDWLYRTFDDGSPVRGIFIRPDDNAKSFTGSVVYDACFDMWYSEATCYDATHNTMAVVAPWRKITHEWRLVVHNGRVITGSQYKRDGEVDIAAGYDPAAATFVEKALHDTNYNPYPIFCVDVCLTDTYNEYKIVEIGSINTCGLYACDMDVIVDAVATEAEKEMKEW
jgi:hypothetical protein